MKHPRRWQKVRFRNHAALPERSGVYAVMKGRQILYIGLSNNIYRRWNSTGDRRHGRYWLASIRASHIAYLPTRNYERLEDLLIDRYSPPWNYTKYPWFWNSDTSWLGKLGAFGWLLWAKRKSRNSPWMKLRGAVLVWSVLAAVFKTEQYQWAYEISWS